MEQFLHSIREAVIDGTLNDLSFDFVFNGDLCYVSNLFVVFGEVHCSFKNFPDGYEDHDVVLDFCDEDFVAAVYHAIVEKLGKIERTDRNLF